MFIMSISFFAIVTAIIIGLLHSFQNRLKDVNTDLPRRVEGAIKTKGKSAADIVTRMKELLTRDLDVEQRKKFTEWVKEYNSNIRDTFVLKILLIADIVMIIIYALYSMLLQPQ